MQLQVGGCVQVAGHLVADAVEDHVTEEALWRVPAHVVVGGGVVAVEGVEARLHELVSLDQLFVMSMGPNNPSQLLPILTHVLWTISASPLPLYTCAVGGCGGGAVRAR
jgi:hypothetical protein